MKPVRLPLALAATAILSACAYLPPADAPARRVSPDYTATGGIMDARAFVYGKRTVVEFDNAPSFLVVKDENGASVEYEKIGRHFRLSRRLDHFTAWVNGRAVTFSYMKTAQAPSKAPAPAPAAAAAPAQVAQPEIPVHTPADPELSALIRLAEQQLKEVRRMLDAASQNSHITGEELFLVKSRLDAIQAQLSVASSAVVRVGFDTGKTQFKPSPDLANVLLAAAKVADEIKIRGRTDSRRAGPADPRIALGRAEAARKFLVTNGVDPDKIQISSRADGDFVAPNLTRAGRALNRRVEIQIVHSRIASLQADDLTVAAR